jgi:superfamily II DNA or RNA helicase
MEARPYQQRIIRRALDLFCQQGLRSILIESPTGSGKTICALTIAKIMQERLGLRIGWVAMRRNLLAQARAENDAKDIQASIEWISMFDRNLPTGLDMIVADEGHHSGATTMAHLYNVIRPRFVLSMSATPFRTDRIKLNFEQVIRDAGIARLIQDGYLSQYHHYTIPDFTPESVVGFYCGEPERWGSTLCYFHTVNQCLEAHRLFQRAGVCSDVVTGSTDRESQIEAFRSGQLDVLRNCQVLVEGFDFPALKTVFARPSCKSATIQMCGRVFRKHPSLPYKQIVQCQTTPWPFVKTALATQQYVWLDGEWRSLTVNPRINEINLRTMKALAGIQTDLPKFLTRQQPGRRRASNRQRDGDLIIEEMVA